MDQDKPQPCHVQRPSTAVCVNKGMCVQTDMLTHTFAL